MLNHVAAEVTEKKKKGKPGMGRLRLFRFLAFFLLFVSIVITILAILGPNINGQIRQTSLSPAYISLATPLLDAPSSAFVESESITVELWDVRSNFYSESDDICVSVRLNYEAPLEAIEQYDNSRLIINNSWVIGAKNALIGGGALRSPVSKNWCGWGELETGIHLIEFELRDSMFGEPIHTQQWAIEIEAD